MAFRCHLTLYYKRVFPKSVNGSMLILTEVVNGGTS